MLGLMIGINQAISRGSSMRRRLSVPLDLVNEGAPASSVVTQSYTMGVWR
jgi:hypothetical protein